MLWGCCRDRKRKLKKSKAPEDSGFRPEIDILAYWITFGNIEPLMCHDKRSFVKQPLTPLNGQVDNAYFMAFTTFLTFYALTADDLRSEATFGADVTQLTSSSGGKTVYTS